MSFSSPRSLERGLLLLQGHRNKIGNGTLSYEAGLEVDGKLSVEAGIGRGFDGKLSDEAGMGRGFDGKLEAGIGVDGWRRLLRRSEEAYVGVG